MTKSIEDAKGDLASDFAALRADVGKLTSSIADLLRSQSATASDSARDLMGTAREKVGMAKDKVADHASFAQERARGIAGDTRQMALDHAAKAQDRFGEATAELETAIERNPLVAILIALGAGMLIGAMSRGRG